MRVKSQWAEEGEIKSTPLLCSNVPTHQSPVGAQSGYLKQGTIKITRICWIVLRCNERLCTLCINLDILNRGSHSSSTWIPIHYINYIIEIRNNIEIEESLEILWLLATQNVVSGQQHRNHLIIRNRDYQALLQTCRNRIRF